MNLLKMPLSTWQCGFSVVILVIAKFAHPSRAIDRSRVQSDSLECWEVQCQSQRLDVIIQQFPLYSSLNLHTYICIYMILFSHVHRFKYRFCWPIIFDTTRSPQFPTTQTRSKKPSLQPNKKKSAISSRTLRKHRHPSALDGYDELRIVLVKRYWSGWWVPKIRRNHQGCIKPCK